MLPFALRAQQNLVPNPSFEDTVYCPEGLSDRLNSCVGWNSPTGGSPDLHHVCQTDLSTGIGVPQNSFGWQLPRTGNAYAGFHFSAFEFGSNSREYIQCKLEQPLEHGEMYLITFYVSRGDYSTIACNLGAYLSKDSVFLATTGVLFYTPQILSPPDKPIVDAENWVTIVDTVIATGGEKYLTIGLFTDDSNTYWVEVADVQPVVVPYYYIDDVSVVRYEEIVDFPNVFTPNGDGMNDTFVVTCVGCGELEMTIYNRWGREVFFSQGNTPQWDGRVNGQTASSGIYFVKIETITGLGSVVANKGFVHLLR